MINRVDAFELIPIFIIGTAKGTAIRRVPQFSPKSQREAATIHRLRPLKSLGIKKRPNRESDQFRHAFEMQLIKNQ